MRVGHIGLTGNTQLSQDLKRDTQLLADVVSRLIKHRDTMIQMRDNDVSGPYLVASYGFTSRTTGTAQEIATADAATADAALNELSSLVGKLTTDAQVTSVASAIKQVGDKFR